MRSDYTANRQKKIINTHNGTKKNKEATEWWYCVSWIQEGPHESVTLIFIWNELF